MSKIEIRTLTAPIRVQNVQNAEVRVSQASSALSLHSLGMPGPAGAAGQRGATGAAGARGAAGLSAYQIAQQAGFTGSEAQWLASLGGGSSNSGLPSGYTAHHQSDILYFGYTSYKGGGWRVVRAAAGAITSAVSTNNGSVSTLPSVAGWANLTYGGA